MMTLLRPNLHMIAFCSYHLTGIREFYMPRQVSGTIGTLKPKAAISIGKTLTKILASRVSLRLGGPMNVKCRSNDGLKRGSLEVM